jgi:hypothetical protein
MNEFNIKNGFISNDNSRIIGGLTATTISATTYENLPSSVPYTGATQDVDLGENNLKTNGLQFTDSDSFIRPSNDVRNWYLTGDVFSVTTIESSPTGIFFKPDGTRFYIIGTGADRVYAYDMSIAWDIKTAIIAEDFSVSVESAPSDLFFKDDGTVLYVLGTTTDLVRQFSLPTPWVLTGATPTGTFNVAPQDGTPTGIYLREDGLKMYVAGDSSPDKVIEYDLSTPWDVTTSVYLQFFSVALEESVISAIDFNDDGTRMYVLGSGGDDITEYRMTTSWDISTASYFSESFTFTQEPTPTGLYYNEQENKAFIIGTGIDTIIGLGTEKEIKLFTNSVVTDGQLYVGGRFEARSSIYSNSSITALGAITAIGNISTSGSLNASNTAFSTGTVTLTQSTLNIGGFTTGTVPATQLINIGYGRLFSGQTKNINIASNSQFGSNTFITIGDANSGNVKSLLDTTFERDVDVVGSLSVNNVNIPLLSGVTATGTINVLDTFTEGSNTLLNLHTPDIGSGWTRVQISTFTTPTFTVFSTGDMGVTTNISNQGVIYIENTLLVDPDYEVSVDLITQVAADDTMWLFARYQDENNFYGVKWSLTIGNCGLYKKVAGVFTLLSTLTTNPKTGSSSLSLRVYDNYIIVLNGGEVVMTAYDESFTLPGKTGIGAGNILQSTADDFFIWRFDNFKVQSFENNFKSSFIKNGNLLIGTTVDEPSSKLTIESTVQGFLPPRMTNTQRLAIVLPAIGLMVYCTDTTEGLYVFKSTGWVFLG